jgi:molybdate/tungstate transport system permease protein
LARTAAAAFAIALLYPLSAFFARIGQWQWNEEVRGPALASIRVSLVLTAAAMVVVVAVGTPVALYVTRCAQRERLLWQALLLVSILLPPLALGILLALAFRPDSIPGLWAHYLGIQTTNSATAFVATQVYVSIGYYILGAVAALESVPRILLKQAALLGVPPWRVFLRITFPLARLGLAAALSMAWVRALGEFGAVVVTAYYPSGMPVLLWMNLETFGLPAVMPLLVVFLSAALPFPWLVHLLAQRRSRA